MKRGWSGLWVALLATAAHAEPPMELAAPAVAERARSSLPELVEFPAGPFTMGCEGELPQCADDRRPIRRITLSAFAIERRPVTQGQYAACKAAGACPMPAEWAFFRPETEADEPVVGVIWGEAETYCRWKGRRLPTEAEWARAAALGAAGAVAAGEADVNAPVRSGAADGAGLYGMDGGPWEWMSDAFTKYGDPVAGVPLVDPMGATNTSARALRGRHPRRTAREAGNPASKYLNIGFRLARTAPVDGPPAPSPPRIYFPDGPPTPLAPDAPSTIVVGVEGFEPDGLAVWLDFEGASSAAGQRIGAFVGRREGDYVITVDWQTLMAVNPVTATPGDGRQSVLVRVVDVNGLNRAARAAIRLTCRVGDQDAPICDGVCQAEVDAVCPE